LTRSTIVEAGSAGQDLTLQLSLFHDDSNDSCYLNSVDISCSDTTPGTTSEHFSTSRDYSIPVTLFEVDFSCQAQVSQWTYDGNFAGRDTIPGWTNGGLLLRNQGNVTYNVDVDMKSFSQLHVYVVMGARGFTLDDECSFVLSFDGFQTVTDPVLVIREFDDTGEHITSPIAFFDKVDYENWDTLDLRMVSSTDKNTAKCYMYQVGVSALRVNPSSQETTSSLRRAV
jgi:hypothetical protein